MIPSQKLLRTDIRLFVSIITLLLIVGIIFIYSASAVFALEKYKSSHYFLKKHGEGLVIGLLGFLILRLVPKKWIIKFCPVAFWTSLLLTMLTFFSAFSVHIHGSSRWLNLFGLVFQPSELLKMTFILYMAFLLTKKEYSLRSLKKTYIPLMMILGITALVLLRQPDFGMAITLTLTAFALMFVAHIPLNYLLITIGGSIPLVIFLILFKAYRLKRILTFLNPWSDPQGAGFQIIQSLIAIGSGNVWGVGISNSQQKFFYLPMQHTDFIFSIIAEETGFFGALFLITLYLLLLFIGLRMAWRLPDRFAMLVVVGFIVVTSLQAIINLAVATGLAPTKGIGLPFISYGNTALVTNLCMVGLIINLVRHAVREETTSIRF